MTCRSRGLSGRSRHDQGGQSLAELGLVIVLFVFLVMGMLEVGHAWMVGNMITHATRDGARAAAAFAKRDTACHITNPGDIQTRVRNQIRNVLDAATVSGFAVTVQQTTADGIPTVRVTVDGQVNHLFNLPPFGSHFAIARTVTFRDEGC